MNRKLRNTLVIAAVVLIAGAALAARLTRGEAATPSSAIVAQEDFRVVVEATGKLEADMENLMLYQKALAEHAKRDEQLRTVGSLASKFFA